MFLNTSRMKHYLESILDRRTRYRGNLTQTLRFQRLETSPTELRPRTVYQKVVVKTEETQGKLWGECHVSFTGGPINWH